MKNSFTQLMSGKKSARIRLLILLPLLFGNILFANAQKTVSGTVLGTDGFSLPGVNIVEKNTSNGVITDFDGKFTIKLTNSEPVLIFSFIGYKKQELPVGNKTKLKVTMEPEVTTLDELVVIGYGVQKKKLVTGATSQVKGEELDKRNSMDAIHALQGQVAGVNIASTSGQPGESSKVIIRGVGSLNGSSPLYIVDGVQMEDIDFLNSSDIESIDILKDAASAAIYGSQAANGVVMVTTKKGKKGSSQISVDAYYGVQNRAKKIDLLNTTQYAMIMNEQHINSGGLPSGKPFDMTDLPAYTEEGSANTDWLDEMFENNSVIQNYSVSAAGASEQSSFVLSLSYFGQEGIVGGKDVSNYERYTGRINSEHKLYNGKIKIGEHIAFIYENKNGIKVGDNYSNTLRGAFNTSPLLPMYDDDVNYFNTADTTLKDQNGETYWNNSESNPYAIMMLANQNINHKKRLLSDVYGEFNITKNLKFRTTLAFSYYGDDYREYTPEYELSIYSEQTYDVVKQTMKNTYTINNDNILTYDISTGSHKFGAMAGISIRQKGGTYLEAENAESAFDDFEHAYIVNTTNQTYPKLNADGYPEYEDNDKLLSYFGRLQYDYKETYLFHFIFRADGSSKFAEGNRWGYFPSVSAGWIVSNESFMAATSRIINFLKIRGSWGQNGDQDIDAFQYLAPISFENVTYAFGDTEGTSTSGAYPSRLANEELKWETSEQINIGFDTRLLNNSLTLNLDWYRKSSKDWLIAAPVLATAGTDAPYINGGNVINTGVELVASYMNNIGDFTYSVSVNGTYSKNKVEEVPTDDGIIHGASNNLYDNSTEFYRVESGHPIGYFWGFVTDGIFQTSQEVEEHLSSSGEQIQPDAAAGDLRYVDINDDGELDDDDKTEIGDPNPNYIFGLALNCSYKAFDFSIIANGVAGNQIVQSYRNQSDKYANYTTEILDRWTGKGSSNKIPRVTTSNINYQFSDLFVHDGNYLRISNVTLGFDLAKVVNTKIFKQCRIYAQVQNLYTITNYSGMDPEVGYGFDNSDTDATDNYSYGIDLGYYPRPRTILGGISIKF